MQSARHYVGEQLDGDTSAWLLELTVLQESDGWLLQEAFRAGLTVIPTVRYCRYLLMGS